MLVLNDFSIYLVTDRQWLNGRKLEDVIEQSILGGVKIVQLREKDIPIEEYINRAYSVQAVCKKHGVPLIINDNIQVAKAIGADGVHLGASDGAISIAREILGENAIIGASARTIEGALSAQEQGADYLGVGAVFGTTTKNNAKTINIGILKDIIQACNIPIFAIGGVTQENITQLKGIKLAGVAVISAILKSSNPTVATQNLLENFKN